MEIHTFPMESMKLGTIKNPLVKEQVKKYLDNKTHSTAYIKLCAIEAKRMGKMELAMALEEIAKSKMENEAVLLEAFGMKEDIKLHLDNIIIRATEDVKLADEISKLARDHLEEETYTLLYQLAKKESENLEALKGITKQIDSMSA